jgi:outer membrane biosynthesis protein TonB
VNFEGRDIVIAVAFAVSFEAAVAVGVWSKARESARPVLQVEAEIAIPVAIAPVARGAGIGAVVPHPASRPASPERPLPDRNPDPNPSPLPSSVPTSAPSSSVAPQPDAGPPDPAATGTVAGPVSTGPVGPATTATGASTGGDGDPLAAQQAGMYRGQLDGWFSSRFLIRGKVPFEQLQHLRATVVVDVDPSSRTVTGFRIVKPSGDPVFDAELNRSLSGIQGGGAALPSPPDGRPELLGSHVTLSFSCTSRARCE